MSLLSSAEIELMLSLPDSELAARLSLIQQPLRDQVYQELVNYRTPQELAESSLIEFVRQAWEAVEPETDFVDTWHIEGICGELEAVTRKQTRNLLINVPPGCMKSLTCNVFWPAWVWIKNPAARFLFASYAQELSTRDSLKMRYLIESNWYQSRWGDRVRLRTDQNQKLRYDTTAGGWRLATSVGGRGTGEHPDYVVADDPHNVKESESDVERKSAIEWWDGTMSTRGITRHCCRVVIMQRLHTEDLSGHMLTKGTELVHVCLPMRFEPGRMKTTPRGFSDPRTEPGELLCPNLFTPQMVATAEKELASQYKIAGQLQQSPVPREGGMFKLPWFRSVPVLPAGCRNAVRYWDKAGTEDGGDWSAGVLIGEFQRIYYVLDVVRGQWSPHQREVVIKETAERDRHRGLGSIQTWVEQEPGSAGKESAQNTIRNLAGHSIRAETASGDKKVRAQPFADQLEGGNVFLVDGPWNKAYVDELTGFPTAKHDDQVDASSGAFNKLANTRRIMVA